MIKYNNNKHLEYMLYEYHFTSTLRCNVGQNKIYKLNFYFSNICKKINRIALPIKKHKLKFRNVYTYRIPYNLQNGNTLLVTCNI